MSNPWIQAARLRTLPLAISGIILGWSVSLPYMENSDQAWMIFGLAILTAVLLQITSNYANDYGDYEKGVDQAAGRTDRMLAAGNIAPKAMKTAIGLLSVITFLNGLLLLWVSGVFEDNRGWFLLITGILAIAAAIYYTVGKHAYGYKGLGDVFVFLFFGVLTVIGMALLLNVRLLPIHGIASIGMGCLSTAVLNINNYRDILSDQAKNKRTLAVIFGKKNTIIYQGLLLALGSMCMVGSLVIIQHDYLQWGTWLRPDFAYTFGLFFPFFGAFSQQFRALKSSEPGDRETINPLLKKLSLSIFALAIVFCFIVSFITS
ncbi:MAG: hypothetical protein RLZZ252_376 [Bacteroidota bacterium]|jgi:1,4-dihydroxy-2-naphthoate octaprenyltransferase